MPGEKLCETARRITGRNTSDMDINMQCSAIDSSDKFLMSKSMEKLLNTKGMTIDEGWALLKDSLETIAHDYLVDPAAAYCLYKDWKRSH